MKPNCRLPAGAGEQRGRAISLEPFGVIGQRPGTLRSQGLEPTAGPFGGVSSAPRWARSFWRCQAGGGL